MILCRSSVHTGGTHGTPMAGPKHPNCGVYWLLKRLPDDLRQAVGKGKGKRSLGTRNPEEAKRRHAEALSEIEAQ